MFKWCLCLCCCCACCSCRIYAELKMGIVAQFIKQKPNTSGFWLEYRMCVDESKTIDRVAFWFHHCFRIFMPKMGFPEFDPIHIHFFLFLFIQPQCVSVSLLSLFVILSFQDSSTHNHPYVVHVKKCYYTCPFQVNLYFVHSLNQQNHTVAEMNAIIFCYSI